MRNQPGKCKKTLNPFMMEVMKAEILKLLDVGVIYPIMDSKWVAPIHVAPKNTLVKNKNEEQIPTRISSGWRMCVDYRKLNLATHKYHFLMRTKPETPARTHYMFQMDQ